ncbi:TonB-dependent receptor [Niveispirillum sp. BGYR6]|uniref:TonB-dependent receptor n=1 Tax=Niveispirillum sp. BGYR6 TaxID=2971249 RepID=UPI0022B9C495|nr:TonB-dependent receptor [Niveispirillum sp. BGYR6]MDG5496366.1 TonB-dependent receptor [Niveispirillum sp. BGYR6]
MSKHKNLRLALGATVAAVSLLPAGLALAQTAPAGDALDEIVVSGYRQSLENAIALKRESSQIVEAVSAEDIGKLPDNSIAEAIARLPGIAAQRVDGRAQSISLRGLGPDFTATLLNGREQVSTGNNRSVEFDQYPSEVMSSVLVYKSPEAGVVGQGLAGTVDLRTMRPLQHGKRVMAMSARTELAGNGKLNPDSDKLGYRVTGAYVDQFANDTLGVAISVAHINQPTQTKYSRAWGYPLSGPKDTPPRVLGGIENRVNSETLKRTGVTATVEYEPTDNFATTLDLYYSHFDDDQIQRGVEMPFYWGGLTPVVGSVDNGLVTAGSFNNVKGVVRNDMRTTKSDLFSAGWNGKYTVESWTLALDASYSKVKRNSERLETYAGTGRAGVGATDRVDFTTGNDGNRLTSRLNYADPSLILLTGPQGWGGDVVPGGQDGYLNKPHVDDKLWAVRGDITKEFDDSAVKSVKLGVNYSSRDKTYRQDEFYLALTANVKDPKHNTSVAIPSAALVGGAADLSFIGVGNVIAYDPRYLLGNGLYTQIACPRVDCAVSPWDLNEDIVTGFIKADIEQDLGDVTLTGNVGLQVVHTDQSSYGAAVTGPGLFVMRTDGRKYTELLPSANLVFALPNPDHKIRVGLSRQMARARPDELRASTKVTFDETRVNNTNPDVSAWKAEGGNAQLKPWMANALDVTYEYYFSKAGYVALNGFYKDLKTYIYKQATVFDFTGFAYTGNRAPVTNLGLNTRPVNGDGGTLKGVELALSLPFEDIHPALEGFGLTANVGYTKTSISPDGPGSSQPIPGFSKWTPQGTFYYDLNGISARVSVSHRSKYRAEVNGFGEGRTLRNGKAETLVDAQIGYEFQEGDLEGLSIVLQGYNLTDEAFVTYENDDTRNTINYEKYGSRYLLGVSYKF